MEANLAMSRLLKPDVLLGLAVVLFALVLLVLWIPNDVDGDIINTVRRRSSIGDPMAPTVSGLLLLFCGAMLVLTGLFRSAGKAGLDRGNLVFLVVACGFLAGVILIMLFAGPLLVAALGVAEEYRLVRASLPWKYTGFLLGGFTLVFTAIVAVERRVRWRTVLLGLVIPLTIAVLYDLPFDDTLLPPNGDY